MGVLILFTVLAFIPGIQRWGREKISDALERQLATHVEIGKTLWRFPNRLIVDDLQLYDRQDSLMLKVARVAAKVEVFPLFQKRVKIRNAQLFGATAVLYKNSEVEPHNFQFIIDAFSSQDTTKKPLDIEIGSLLIRRCNVSYDERYKPATPGHLNPAHLHIKDLSVTAQLKKITRDSINVVLKKMSLEESCGMRLERLTAELVMGSRNAWLKELTLALPLSSLSAKDIRIEYDKSPFNGPIKQWLKSATYRGTLAGNVTPSELAPLMSRLATFREGIAFSSDIEGRGDALRLKSLHVCDTQRNADLRADFLLADLMAKPSAEFTIDKLTTKSQVQEFLTRNLQGKEREISPYLTRLGNMEITGGGSYRDGNLESRLAVSTRLGKARIEGTLSGRNHVDSELQLEDFLLDKLLERGKDLVEKLSLQARVNGDIKDQEGRPNLKAEGVISSMLLKGYPYRNIAFRAACKDRLYEGDINMNDVNAGGQINVSADLRNGGQHFACLADIDQLNPYTLNLTKRYEGEVFSFKMEADIRGKGIENLNGTARLDSLRISSAEQGTLRSGPILVSSRFEEGERLISVESDALSMDIKGQYKWRNLRPTFIQIANLYLPSIFQEHYHTRMYQDDISFTAAIQDTALISRLSGIKIAIPERATLYGKMDGSLGLLNLNAQLPELTYGSEKLEHVGLILESTSKSMRTSIQLERLMKGQPIGIGLDMDSGDDMIHSRLHWNNKKTTRAQVGEIDVTGRFSTDLRGKKAILGEISQSNIIINDTLWTVHPARLSYHDEMLELDSIKVSKADRYLTVNGRVSKLESDSIVADIHRINLGYVFDIINFHTVDFDGQATGRVYASNLGKKPRVNAFLQVSDFTFNEGEMGTMDTHVSWGEREGSILIDALMNDPENGHQTKVLGVITPGHKPGSGLDLKIDTKRCNMYFLNKFTKKIFTDFRGRASGWAHVFGAFKNINLEGDVLAEEASLHVNALGVDYHLQNDSIILRPDNIYIRNATIYDRQGKPGGGGHYATMNGHLQHTHLSQLRYNFDIDCHNILGYDFRNLGENDFYGTAYATGTMKLTGQPGELNVDLQCTPATGTRMVYNVSRPETLTEAGFITYKSHEKSAEEDGGETVSLKKEASGTDQTQTPEDEGNDIRINFDLNITPDATMRLLMDARSGDYIDLNGYAQIRARYHNKGKFQMYGTYTVDHGIYKLSLQDFIRKEFQFEQGGTLAFRGDPYLADIDLKARYSVPNVSLDDLSATSLGLSNTRVDCIMNITGRPEAPMVNFDFDLPNANEDERQMVRSMLSTDEERNMQVIYLLGIGRFYNQSMQYVSAADQSTTAVNSLLSSTLSSQFNQIMSNAMGTNNWSFGANLRTGETGWDQLDAEAILSGRLLNNRLLINGNFGYRESYYSTNNFIGDFDVQYLLTPGGGISLKAYNQTNDRYFIQSSLTTQGIGIQFKKDFNKWRDLMGTKRKGKKKRK